MCTPLLTAIVWRGGRMDEDPRRPWTVAEAALDSLAAAMIVFILCDFWRLYIGRLPGVQGPKDLPWQEID